MRYVNISVTENDCVLIDNRFAGYQDELNATELVIALPESMLQNIDYYILSFGSQFKDYPPSGFITSESSEGYIQDGKIHYVLSSTYTASETLYVTVEAYRVYDQIAVMIKKTPRIGALKFGKSQKSSDKHIAESGGLTGVIAQNAAARHYHTNKNVLDKLSGNGSLKYDGNEIAYAESIPNPYSEIEKIKDYLFSTYYTALDYDFAKKYFVEHSLPVVGGCSTIRNGDFLGRNFDWKYDNGTEMRVSTPKINGRYAVIGTASILGLTDEKVESKEYDEIYKIVPFRLVDGMNEKGVVASTNVVPAENGNTGKSVPAIEERGTICTSMLIRYILDNFATAREAVEYIRDYISLYTSNTLTEMDYEAHFEVCDEEESFLLEIIDNAVVITDMTAGANSTLAGKPYMTNFPLNGVVLNSDGTVYTPETSEGELNPEDYNLITPHGSGLERYNYIVDNYSTANTKEGMEALLAGLKYTNAYKETTSPFWYTEFVGGDITVKSPVEDYADVVSEAINAYEHRSRDTGLTWQTVHSVIYDIKNKAMYLKTQEDDDEIELLLPYENDVEIPEYLDKEFTDYTEGLEFGAISGTQNYVVTGYTGTDSNVVVPKWYKGDNGWGLVTHIGENAFKDNKIVQDVKLPDSIKEIRGSAFEDSSLYHITLSNNLVHIWWSAFSGCPLSFGSINEAFVFPETIESVGNSFERTSIKKLVINENIQWLNLNLINGVENVEVVIKGTDWIRMDGTSKRWLNVFATDGEYNRKFTFYKYVDDTTISEMGIDTSQGDTVEFIQFSGNYNDLADKPTIPTGTSELINDSDFQTSDDVTNLIENSELATITYNNEGDIQNMLNGDVILHGGSLGGQVYLGDEEDEDGNIVAFVFDPNADIEITLQEKIDSDRMESWDSVVPLIPGQASDENQLADKDFVNSTVNSMSAFPIYADDEGNPFATKAALLAAETYYTADGSERIPTTNDYTYVTADESKTDPVTGENPSTRYVYSTDSWGFQMIVNKNALTAAQFAALQSGITSAKVGQIDEMYAIKHTHNNKTTLDKFGESSGKPTYNGEAIGGAVPTITISASQIIDTDPTKVELTEEQLATLNETNNRLFILDLTALGYRAITLEKQYVNGNLGSVYYGTLNNVSGLIVKLRMYHDDESDANIYTVEIEENHKIPPIDGNEDKVLKVNFDSTELEWVEDKGVDTTINNLTPTTGDTENVFTYTFAADKIYKIETPTIPTGFAYNYITFSFPSVTDIANEHRIKAFVYISTNVVFNWGTAGSINFLNSKLPTVNSGETYLLDAVFDPNTEKWCVSMTRQASTGIYDLPSDVIPLDECTREQILAVIQHGYANALNQWCVRRPNGEEQVWWEIGDSFDITLTDNRVLTFQIAGFNYDVLADGSGKAKITFIMKDLWFEKVIRGSDGISYDWSASGLYRVTIPSIFALFPTEWQNAMASVFKETPKSSTENETTADKLFCPSENELSTNNSYPIFTNDESRIKNLGGTQTATDYFIRFYRTGNYGGVVSSTGAVSTHTTVWDQTSRGLCLGFCLNG